MLMQAGASPHTQSQATKDTNEVNAADFIPYCCHYDKATVLTKNGELLQTIKITGFSSEDVSQKKIPLREAVRKAIFGSVDSKSYALWFHTFRRRKSLDPGGEFPPGFSHYLDNRWRELNQWDKKYVNELYITVVREGQNASITNPAQFMRALVPGLDRKNRLNFLEEAHRCLDNTVSKMLHSLQEFGARRLEIVDRNGIYHSEMMEFVSKIINLQQEPFPVGNQDVSRQLPSHQLFFGFNRFEVRGATGRHHGAVMTIKEYRELALNSLDQFLQLPMEFIISQCIDFINPKRVKSHFVYQKKMNSMAEESELAKDSGLDDILNSDRGHEIDYGENQINIMMLNDSVESLEKDVTHAFNTLKNLGIVAMREDLRMEECYWSMLPSNFAFVKRLKPINTARIAGFASLYNFPAGQVNGNLWGPATTIFYTAARTPYFFNFHNGDNGHTTIIGPFGSGKTVMLNFLCCQARKYDCRLFFFDKERGSEVFIRAIGGEYHKLVIDSKAGKLTMNPLLLADSDQTRGFLAEWLWSMLTSSGEYLDEEEFAVLHEAVAHCAEMPEEQKRLTTIAHFFQQQGASRLYKLLQPWHGNGQFAYLFDHPVDNLDLNGMAYGFEMGNIIRENGPLKPALEYLFYRISLMLDGTRTMMVLDEAWEMLDNELFAPKIHAWLDLLQANNAMAILATESVEDASESAISQDIMRHISTEIYFPNRLATPAYREVFGLTQVEYALLNRMRSDERQFLLKHGGKAVVSSLNLAEAPDLLAVLSSTEEMIQLYDAIIEETGEDPMNWLPVYIEKLTGMTIG